VLTKGHDAWREEQKAGFRGGTKPSPYPEISDDEIRDTIESNQLRLIKERGADLTLFSPRAWAMAPHVGDADVAKEWAIRCNDLIARVVGFCPKPSPASGCCHSSPRPTWRTASRSWSDACIQYRGRASGARTRKLALSKENSPMRIALAGAGAFGEKHLDGMKNIHHAAVPSLEMLLAWFRKRSN
jgi:hypothetical protein